MKKSAVHKVKPAVAKNSSRTAKKPRPAREVKPQAKSAHHRTERSRTLMRAAVARPGGHIKSAASKVFARPAAVHVATVDPLRASHAKSVAKHHKVERFGVPRPRKAEETKSGEVLNPSHNNIGPKNSSIAPAPASLAVSASHQHLERLLDEALAQADSHKQSLRRRSKNPFRRMPRWLAIALVLALAVVVALFIAWREVPQVAVKVASTRAHVNASVPAYTPTGFTYRGPAEYKDNSVTVQYQDKMTPSNNFSLTQTKSSWNSTSLAANYLSSAEKVQTAQVQGTTVYIYGSGSDATWVNNGIWYKITNQAGLSSEQILRIVQSM